MEGDNRYEWDGAYRNCNTCRRYATYDECVMSLCTAKPESCPHTFTDPQCSEINIKIAHNPSASPPTRLTYPSQSINVNKPFAEVCTADVTGYMNYGLNEPLKNGYNWTMILMSQGPASNWEYVYYQVAYTSEDPDFTMENFKYSVLRACEPLKLGVSRQISMDFSSKYDLLNGNPCQGKYDGHMNPGAPKLPCSDVSIYVPYEGGSPHGRIWHHDFCDGAFLNKPFASVVCNDTIGLTVDRSLNSDPTQHGANWTVVLKSSNIYYKVAYISDDDAANKAILEYELLGDCIAVPSEQPTQQPTEQPTAVTTTANTTNTSSRKYCGGGQYVQDKNTDHESCGSCPAGRFSKETTVRNRRCEKCKVGTYAQSPGSSRCVKCPDGFNTKGQRGKKQCFDEKSGKSMRSLGWKFNSAS
jgi:hypothetical protein